METALTRTQLRLKDSPHQGTALMRTQTGLTRKQLSLEHNPQKDATFTRAQLLKDTLLTRIQLSPWYSFRQDTALTKT
jgi:hypothetical protein